MITTAPELIYMLKVNIGIALFYAFYKLFCCRDTFFQWRRIALLSFLALSFLYPLMDMQAWVKEQPAINELADYYALMMLTETNTSTATVVTAPVAIPTSNEGYTYGQHHPKVKFDDSVLFEGSAAYAYMALRWLQEHK